MSNHHTIAPNTPLAARCDITGEYLCLHTFKVDLSVFARKLDLWRLSDFAKQNISL
jgi:hypothetical protein